MNEQQPERAQPTAAERKQIEAAQAHQRAAGMWSHWEQTKDEAARVEAIELSAIANELSRALSQTNWMERNLPASDEAQHRKLMNYHAAQRIRARRQQ